VSPRWEASNQLPVHTTAVCPLLFVTVRKQSYAYRKEKQIVFGSQRVSKRWHEYSLFPVKVITILLISVQYKQQEFSKLLDPPQKKRWKYRKTRISTDGLFAKTKMGMKSYCNLSCKCQITLHMTNCFTEQKCQKYPLHWTTQDMVRHACLLRCYINPLRAG